MTMTRRMRVRMRAWAMARIELGRRAAEERGWRGGRAGGRGVMMRKEREFASFSFLPSLLRAGARSPPAPLYTMLASPAPAATRLARTAAAAASAWRRRLAFNAHTTPPDLPPPPLALTIHFCAACGYGPWVTAAAQAATAAASPSPPVTVTGVAVPTVGAFEVFVSEGGGEASTPAPPPVLAWSKLDTGQPSGIEGVGPVVQAVLAEVGRRRKGGGGACRD